MGKHRHDKECHDLLLSLVLSLAEDVKALHTVGDAFSPYLGTIVSNRTTLCPSDHADLRQEHEEA